MATRKNSPRPVGPGAITRIGGALACPQWALGRSDGSGDGRSGTDAAILIALAFAAIHSETLVSHLWAIGAGDMGSVLALMSSVAHAVAKDLVFIFVAGVAITLIAGRKRQPSRDFDMALVAFVPLIVVEIVAHLIVEFFGLVLSRTMTDVFGVIAYGWAAAIAILACRVARRRDPQADPESVPSAPSRATWAGRAVVLFSALLATLNGIEIARDPGRVRPVVAGDHAPSLLLPIVDSEGAVGETSLDLADLRGRIVVIDFWATWCGPCRQSMPVVEKVYQRFRGRGVEVLSVNTEGRHGAKSAHDMFQRFGLTSTLLVDEGAASLRFKVTTIPHMVVVDREGVVRFVHRGFTTAGGLESDLVEAIQELLE